MRRSTPSLNQHGYTLIELLLYVVIVSSLLMALTGFFGLMVEARVKNQSIAEVDEQGAAAMDYLIQTVRNATAITAPAAAGTGSSLTLTVPTGSLSPTIFDLSGGGSTVMGFNADGGSTDTGVNNNINATKFTASASGTVSTLFALIGGTVASSPNNQAQMAIYSGNTTAPATLLASSASTTITPNSWISFSIPPVSVTSGQIYWLAYNTNGVSSLQNGFRFHTGTTNQTTFATQTFGTWPSAWLGGSFSNDENSMYAFITTGGGSGALQIKEGTGSAVALTNDNVTISNLTFKNLTRSSTAGTVQISFTAARVNPTGRNEYTYQKTFTSSAEIGW